MRRKSFSTCNDSWRRRLTLKRTADWWRPAQCSRQATRNGAPAKQRSRWRLKAGQIVAGHGCRAASGDVELAIALLRVGLVGARSSLELKLTSLTDPTYTQAVVHEIARLSEEGITAASAAESSLRIPPA